VTGKQKADGLSSNGGAELLNIAAVARRGRGGGGTGGNWWNELKPKYMYLKFLYLTYNSCAKLSVIGFYWRETLLISCFSL
jgi:hypothetical protein